MSAYNIQTPWNYPEESIQHSEHGVSLKSIIIYIAFPLQQWLHEHASILRRTYICLSCYWLISSKWTENLWLCNCICYTYKLKVILLGYNEVCFETMLSVICLWTCSILLCLFVFGTTAPIGCFLYDSPHWAIASFMRFLYHTHTTTHHSQ